MRIRAKCQVLTAEFAERCFFLRQWVILISTDSDLRYRIAMCQGQMLVKIQPTNREDGIGLV